MEVDSCTFLKLPSNKQILPYMDIGIKHNWVTGEPVNSLIYFSLEMKRQFFIFSKEADGPACTQETHPFRGLNQHCTQGQQTGNQNGTSTGRLGPQGTADIGSGSSSN